MVFTAVSTAAAAIATAAVGGAAPVKGESFLPEAPVPAAVLTVVRADEVVVYEEEDKTVFPEADGRWSAVDAVPAVFEFAGCFVITVVPVVR